MQVTGVVTVYKIQEEEEEKRFLVRFCAEKHGCIANLGFFLAHALNHYKLERVYNKRTFRGAGDMTATLIAQMEGRDPVTIIAEYEHRDAEFRYDVVVNESTRDIRMDVYRKGQIIYTGIEPRELLDVSQELQCDVCPQ